MRCLALAVLLSALAPTLAAGAASAGEAPDYAPLKLYDGAWKARFADSKGAPQVVTIANSCARVGVNFACQQSVDGAPGGTTLFLPGATRGQWRTRRVSPTGETGGEAGALTIEGPVWTFLDQEKTAAGVAWTRNINRFSGPDRIHFEIAASSDGKTWTPGLAGDEVRVQP